jgi:4-amino-4-deoxy-L-arabinose transferase-like glycosyltransferase
MPGARSVRIVPHAILLVVIVVGGYLRLHHIDYPPIGYHSMKEVHYLSIAHGYLEHGDFLHKRVLYTGLSAGEGYMEAFPQFPLLPVIYYPLWKLFGVKLWIARLVVILFSLGAVALTYAVGMRLTKNETISLLSACFMAMLPLPVFFGRNIQPDMPALFFLLLGTLSYLRWIDGLHGRDLAAATAAIIAVALVKGTFLIGVIPLLCIFPYGKLADRAARGAVLRQSAVVAAGIVLVLGWLLVTKRTLVYADDLFPRDRLFRGEALTAAFWKLHLPIVWKYIGENYTVFVFGLFAAGFVIGFLNVASRLSRYLIGSLAAAVLYFVLISDFAVRHGYYQLPFLPMICFGAASALKEAASFADLSGRRYFKYLVIALVLVLMVPSVRAGTDKLFDIIMLGGDVAGAYIGRHSDPGERILISYGSPSDNGYAAFRTQFYGILWEARRRGEILPGATSSLREAERAHGIKWIVMYETPWRPADRPLLDYIHAHYAIRQIGYRDDEVLYYVLERGGVFDPSPFEDIDPVLARRYDYSNGSVELYVKER